MYKNVEIIAEVKTKSPFGFSTNKGWGELFLIANKVGDIIAVHTDKRWGGSFDLITKAKRMTDKPILAKGVHSHNDDIKKALFAGADCVLIVGRIPKVHQKKCIIEPCTLKELEKIPKELRALWNTRDLKTGNPKKETFSEARKLFGGWLCQASFIQTVDDIEKGADAVLVGTHLSEFAQSLK